MARERDGRDEILRALDRHLGRRLRERRRTSGLTQAALGEMIGVASQQVAKYETGENTIAASRLFLVAHALGIDVATFLDGVDAVLGPALAAPERCPDPDSAARSRTAARDSLELAEIVRTIQNRQTRDLLLTLSKTLAKGSG